MLEFLVWTVGGGFVALGCMFYDMWQSRKGEDKVSQCRKLYENKYPQ